MKSGIGFKWVFVIGILLVLACSDDEDATGPVVLPECSGIDSITVTTDPEVSFTWTPCRNTRPPETVHANLQGLTQEAVLCPQNNGKSIDGSVFSNTQRVAGMSALPAGTSVLDEQHFFDGNAGTSKKATLRIRMPKFQFFLGFCRDVEPNFFITRS